MWLFLRDDIAVLDKSENDPEYGKEVTFTIDGQVLPYNLSLKSFPERVLNKNESAGLLAKVNRMQYFQTQYEGQVPENVDSLAFLTKESKNSDVINALKQNVTLRELVNRSAKVYLFTKPVIPCVYDNKEISTYDEVAQNASEQRIFRDNFKYEQLYSRDNSQTVVRVVLKNQSTPVLVSVGELDIKNPIPALISNPNRIDTAVNAAIIHKLVTSENHILELDSLLEEYPELDLYALKMGIRHILSEDFIKTAEIMGILKNINLVEYFEKIGELEVEVALRNIANTSQNKERLQLTDLPFNWSLDIYKSLSGNAVISVISAFPNFFKNVPKYLPASREIVLAGLRSFFLNIEDEESGLIKILKTLLSKKEGEEAYDLMKRKGKLQELDNEIRSFFLNSAVKGLRN